MADSDDGLAVVGESNGFVHKRPDKRQRPTNPVRSADAVSLLADEDAPMLNNRPNRPTISTLANICGSIRDMSRAVDLPVTQQ